MKPRTSSPKSWYAPPSSPALCSSRAHSQPVTRAHPIPSYPQVADPKKRFTPHQILNHKWITQKTCRTLPLTHTMANLKAFNARRRFKNAVNVVRAAHLFSRAGPTTVGGNTGAARKLGDLTEGDEGEEEAAIAAAEAEEAAAEAEVAAAAAATAGAGAGAGGGAGAPAGKSDKFDKSDRFDAALY